MIVPPAITGAQATGTSRRPGIAAAFAALLVLSGCGGEKQQPPPPAPAPPPAAVAPPQPAQPDRPLTPDEIASVQAILASRGFDPGPTDGKMGPKTSRAIARYQSASGLPVDGLATASLIRHMQGQPDTAPEIVAVEPAIPAGLYPVGARFIYSGIEIHTVTDVAGARVSWETNLGDHYVTGPHFGLPELEWQSGTWKGTAKSTLAGEASWPPARGMNVHFDVSVEEWNEAEGKNAQRYVGDSSWSCSNQGPKTIKVPAGSFETQTILCERSPAPAGAWQKRIWYYLPTADHFVRRHDFDGAGLEIAEMDLIAILPGGGSRSLQKGLEGAIHDALDRVAPGQTTIWRNPVGAEVYLIKVGGRFDGPGGKPCRSYSIADQQALPRREYPALACQGAGKRRWVTPGLD